MKYQKSLKYEKCAQFVRTLMYHNFQIQISRHTRVIQGITDKKEILYNTNAVKFHKRKALKENKQVGTTRKWQKNNKKKLQSPHKQ